MHSESDLESESSLPTHARQAFLSSPPAIEISKLVDGSLTRSTNRRYTAATRMHSESDLESESSLPTHARQTSPSSPPAIKAGTTFATSPEMDSQPHVKLESPATAGSKHLTADHNTRAELLGCCKNVGPDARVRNGALGAIVCIIDRNVKKTENQDGQRHHRCSRRGVTRATSASCRPLRKGYGQCRCALRRGSDTSY
jgi:hypothetical protein